MVHINAAITGIHGAAIDTAATTRHGGWLDEIDMSVVAGDAAVSQLQAGTIDLFAGDLNGEKLPAIEQAGLSYAAYRGTFYSLLFNPAEFNNGKLNPFHDKKIREAMNWLVDRNYINDEI